MPQHLAFDANVLSGTVRLEGVKTAEVQFRNSEGQPITFSLAPRIVLTVLQQTASTPYKVKNTRAGDFFTGFMIGFASAVTCDVEWQASERM